jgi:hypothetical protein
MTAASDILFNVNEDRDKLFLETAAAFHAIVAKTPHVTKLARTDKYLAIAFVTTRVVLTTLTLTIGRSNAIY